MPSWSQDPQGYIEERSTPVPFCGCWLWTQHTVNEYGCAQIDGRSQKAHRASYTAFVGPIPEGMMVCHTCDVPSCVNPNHLFLGTQQDNMEDMHRKGRGVSRSGESSGVSKLTNAQVLAIRADSRKTAEIASEYGIVRQSVMNIKNGITWGHLDAA